MTRARSLGTLLGAVKSLISRMTGVRVGNLVALEDVGGSPGLPPVDGSQLTGISTGQTSYSFGDSTLDTNLLPRVRAYWPLLNSESLSLSREDIAPNGMKTRLMRACHLGAVPLNSDLKDGAGLDLNDDWLSCSPQNIIPPGIYSSFGIRFLIKMVTGSGYHYGVWLDPFGSDYTNGLGIDFSATSTLIRVVQNAANKINVAGFPLDTLLDVMFYREYSGGSINNYLYVNGAYAGAYTTGTFKVSDVGRLSLGFRGDTAAWHESIISDLMVIDGDPSSFIAGLYNSGNPRVLRAA